jgi:voltage-gated potassium channel
VILSERIREIYHILRHEKLFRIIGITAGIIFYSAIALFIADRYYYEKGIGGLFDAIYWAIVTISTVGYGDIVPSTHTGRVLALLIIISGPILLSFITASIASLFVERKMKEERGLEEIKDRDHFVICGWNENGEKVIDGLLSQFKGSDIKIVLVNELPRDEIQSILYHYKDHQIRYVRGNFVKEDVLARANITKARAIVVLADVSGGHSLEKADERTIFGIMAIKSMAPKVRTCAELINTENKEHLLRTNVDEIVVRGESSGAMLSTGASSPGVNDLLRLLINGQDENRIWRVPIPNRYVGKRYGEISSYMKEKFGALCLGILKEKERIQLSDLLSGDSTALDLFIQKKFEESGKDFFGGKKDILVVINPDDDYEIPKNSFIVVISKERPVLGLVEKLVSVNQ